MYDPSLPKLSAIDKANCEMNLTLQKLRYSLKTFAKNKSPGTDGIMVEFYDKLWDYVGEPMLDSFLYSFNKGELSTSQKQGIITLLEKQGKDKKLIKNWQPISLMNHDYKLLTEALTLRIRKVLPNIIHHIKLDI